MALIRGGGVAVATEVIVHVRGDGCTLDDGTPIAGTIVERIAPQSFLRALIHDAERRPINASGRQRHPTARQKRVVRERDRACKDCGSTDLLEYDHDPPYEQTHRTTVEELKGRCAVCHHRRHPRGC
jgi:5-methylcytosine-specific restriction endonuclease McrA